MQNFNEESPWQDKRYRDFLDVTPVRRTEKERRQQNGILSTPKFKFHRKEIILEDFKYLPQEVYLIIFKYLSVYDLITVSKCCRQFYQLSRESSLWKRHYTDLFFGDRRHFLQVRSLKCIVKVKGNIHNPTVYCDNEAHFISPDGQLPKHKKQFYLRTLERLYQLFNNSLKEKKKKLIESSIENLFVGFSKRDSLHQIKEEKKKLDAKFLWVFKKLYPNKYPNKH
jgi:hypothetical protein